MWYMGISENVNIWERCKNELKNSLYGIQFTQNMNYRTKTLNKSFDLGII